MQITTPDIGVDKATVAEILVKVGDTIAVDDSIVLLESDKASVEVPSTSAGVVKSILVSLGDSIAEGAVLIELEAEGQTAAPVAEAPKAEEKVAPVAEAKVETAPQAVATSSQVVDVQVPDIGVEKALVGEILVAVGDTISVDDSIVVVESDKATVEVPSTVAGVVEAITIQVGDSVKEGVVILKVKTEGSAPAASTESVKVEATPVVEAPVASAPTVTTTASGPVEIAVPDLGVDKAAVAEILVSVGDKVEKDQSIIVVESDKATVEVPSTTAGTIKAIHVALGQNVSEGIALVTIEAEGQVVSTPAPVAKTEAPKAVAPVAEAKAQVAAPVATNNVDKLKKE